MSPQIPDSRLPTWTAGTTARTPGFGRPTAWRDEGMRTMCEIVMDCGPLDGLRWVAAEVGMRARMWWPFGDALVGVQATASPRIATGALLLEVACADGKLSVPERRFIEAVLVREYGLDTVQAERLLRKAEAERRRASGAHFFATRIVQQLSARQRARLHEILRGLADIDGGPSPDQQYAVRRLSSLLRLEVAHA